VGYYLADDGVEKDVCPGHPQNEPARCILRCCRARHDPSINNLPTWPGHKPARWLMR